MSSRTPTLPRRAELPHSRVFGHFECATTSPSPSPHCSRLAAARGGGRRASSTIKGAGFGHGIGMSQYGAYGYAQHGFDYKDILRRYYTETELETRDARPSVRVLLQLGLARDVHRRGGRAAGASSARASAYSAVARGGRVAPALRRGQDACDRRRAAARDRGPRQALRVFGTATSGQRDGRYRGALELRPSGRRLLAINALGLEDYVRGVISAESPRTWPAEALKAQAVAARTYAITTRAGGSLGFDQYADTRSQMYKGVAAEFPSTDAAVAATKSEVVTYGGRRSSPTSSRPPAGTPRTSSSRSSARCRSRGCAASRTPSTTPRPGTAGA